MRTQITAAPAWPLGFSASPCSCCPSTCHPAWRSRARPAVLAADVTLPPFAPTLEQNFLTFFGTRMGCECGKRALVFNGLRRKSAGRDTLCRVQRIPKEQCRDSTQGACRTNRWPAHRLQKDDLEFHQQVIASIKRRKLLILREVVGDLLVRNQWENHVSRFPGVAYAFSGRSLMDKSKQVTAECRREPWRVDLKTAAPRDPLAAEEVKNLSPRASDDR
jgi:hypothetical protein